uniref:F-box domain-containing protein n=1 Tax=Caenorhabditis tropicalis TaxID=1561998 RepID=A0A1I7TUP2_9PELO
MDAFPLYHLPLVAMEHVLCMMNPFQLIELSKTSFRFKRAVRSFSRIRPKFRIDLGIRHQPNIVILGTNDSWTYSWATIFKCSNYPMEELRKMHDHIKEVLRSPLETLYYKLELFPSENKSITDWLRSQHESVHHLELVCYTEGFDDDLKYLVSGLKITGKLYLLVTKYEENFQIEIPESPSHLKLSHSSFISYEQFLTLRHPKITLHRSILTDQKINHFLKSWMSCESHLELKLFEISTSGPEAKDVIMDVPHEVTTEPSVVIMLNEKFEFSNIKCGYNIKRSDGKAATVCFGNLRDLLYMIIN